MEEKIENIQKEVDEMLRLCASAEAVPDEALQDKFSKLGYLILRWQDSDLEEEHFQLLQQWLHSDTEALDYFLDFQSLTAMLYSYFHTDRDAKILDMIKETMTTGQGGSK